MTELVKFECPRCQRPYELNLNLADVRRKRQRAKCARCGERFDIASRVEALRVGGKEESSEPPAAGNAGVAGSAIAVRLAAALRGKTSDDPLAEEGTTRGAANQEFVEDGPPTVSESRESLAGVMQSGLAGADQAIGSEDQEEEEDEEANLPEPLDWLAAAGTGLEILHGELSERERELADLISS